MDGYKNYSTETSTRAILALKFSMQQSSISKPRPDFLTWETESERLRDGAPSEYDALLRDEVVRRGETAGLQAGTLGQRDPYLDHGTFVPLYFLRGAGVDCPILRAGLSGFSPLDHD